MLKYFEDQIWELKNIIRRKKVIEFGVHKRENFPNMAGFSLACSFLAVLLKDQETDSDFFFSLSLSQTKGGKSDVWAARLSCTAS